MKKDDHTITKISTWTTSSSMLAEKNNNQNEQDHDLQPDHGKHGIGDPNNDTYSFGLLFLKLFNGKSLEQNKEQTLVLWAEFLMKKDDHTIKEFPTLTIYSYMLAEENNNQDKQGHDLQPDHGKHGIGNPNDDTYYFGQLFLKLFNGKKDYDNEKDRGDDNQDDYNEEGIGDGHHDDDKEKDTEDTGDCDQDDGNKEDTGDGHHDEDTEEGTSDSDQDDEEDYQAENESDQKPEQKEKDREKKEDEAKESERGSSVAEKIKKTLALLEQSGPKNSTTRDSYDSMNESPPRASRNVSPLKINLRDNPCYSPTSPMIMQTMVDPASSSEEQLVNLTKLVEGLTKHVQHQESRIDKLMDLMEGLLDGEASHAPEKYVEVQEIGDPAKKAPLVNDMQAREGLGYNQPPPVSISIRRARNNHITFKDDVTAPNRKPSVFDRLGESTARTFVFERLGPLKKKNNKHQRSCLKVTTLASSMIQKDFKSLIPSKMMRRVELVVSFKEELKAKAHTVA
uniref:Diacylglycerol kinase eta n=1 Tax=Solanum tuberosum TaxID=4113 RepID=M1DAW0_SOLTU